MKTVTIETEVQVYVNVTLTVEVPDDFDPERCPGDYEIIDAKGPMCQVVSIHDIDDSTTDLEELDRLVFEALQTAP